jgi:Uma2 family endonuclease
MLAPLIAPELETFPNRVRWTVEECYELVDAGYLKGRYEVIDGEIISKTGQNPPHRIVLKMIEKWLLSLFDTLCVHIQGPIRIPGDEGRNTEPEPDIVVTLEPTTAYQEQNPGPDDLVVAIEVADSSLSFDTKTKALLYARVGIREFWAADVNGCSIHVFREPTEDGYRYHSIVDIEGFVSLESRPADAVAVGSFFSALTHAEPN